MLYLVPCLLLFLYRIQSHTEVVTSWRSFLLIVIPISSSVSRITVSMIESSSSICHHGKHHVQSQYAHFLFRSRIFPCSRMSKFAHTRISGNFLIISIFQNCLRNLTSGLMKYRISGMPYRIITSRLSQNPNANPEYISGSSHHSLVTLG